MSRSHFIAARSSRHRVAALALYRALIRSAAKVQLPPSLQVRGPRSSLVKLVRKRFAKNTPLTSFRLIYASMAAGYKFLALLAKAQTPDCPEHAQVVDILQKQQHTSQASRDAHPRPKAQPSIHHDSRRTRGTTTSGRQSSGPRAPVLPTEPLLTNTAPPGHPPSYTSNILPRPVSSLSALPRSARRVPTICATAEGQPFLRIAKPQPRALSRMIGRKGNVFSNRIVSIMNVDEELVPQAALEDKWDSLMEKLERKEGSGPQRRSDPEAEAAGAAGAEAADRRKNEIARTDEDAPQQPEYETTFGWSAQLSRLWYEYKIETTWEDWVARGTALQKLVQAEKALHAAHAAKSASISVSASASDRPTHGRTPAKHPQRDASPGNRSNHDNNDHHLGPPNVGRSPIVQLPVVVALREYHALHPPPARADNHDDDADDDADADANDNANANDPFATDTWAFIVRSQTKRMLVWLRKGSSGLNNAHDMAWKTGARKGTKAQASPDQA